MILRLGGKVPTDKEFRTRRLVPHSDILIDDHLDLLLDDDSPVRRGNQWCDATMKTADAVTLVAPRRVDGGKEATVDDTLHTGNLSRSITYHRGSAASPAVVTSDG